MLVQISQPYPPSPPRLIDSLLVALLHRNLELPNIYLHLAHNDIKLIIFHILCSFGVLSVQLIKILVDVLEPKFHPD